MLMNQQIQQLLKRNQLSVTDSRSKILELFLQQNGALAHADIEKKSGASFDRVTVYRTLQTFVEKGIIHTIPTADNSILYALCKDACTEGHHTTIMYILSAANAVIPFAWKILLCLR